LISLHPKGLAQLITKKDGKSESLQDSEPLVAEVSVDDEAMLIRARRIILVTVSGWILKERDTKKRGTSMI